MPLWPWRHETWQAQPLFETALTPIKNRDDRGTKVRVMDGGNAIV